MSKLCFITCKSIGKKVKFNLVLFSVFSNRVDKGTPSLLIIKEFRNLFYLSFDVGVFTFQHYKFAI